MNGKVIGTLYLGPEDSKITLAMTFKIKLFLADSYSLFMEGLSIMLSSSDNFEVVGVVSNQHKLIEEIGKSNCDVLLVDYNLFVEGARMFIVELKKIYNKKILILYDSHHISYLKKIQSDVDGFLSKDSNRCELYDKISEVFNSIKPKKTLQANYIYSTSQQDFISKYRLTTREIEVIQLIALEFSSAEIANKLCISEFTFNTYHKNITKKLNARNIASIVNFAHRWQLV